MIGQIVKKWQPLFKIQDGGHQHLLYWSYIGGWSSSWSNCTYSNCLAKIFMSRFSIAFACHMAGLRAWNSGTRESKGCVAVGSNIVVSIMMFIFRLDRTNLLSTNRIWFVNLGCQPNWLPFWWQQFMRTFNVHTGLLYSLRSMAQLNVCRYSAANVLQFHSSEDKKYSHDRRSKLFIATAMTHKYTLKSCKTNLKEAKAYIAQLQIVTCSVRGT